MSKSKKAYKPVPVQAASAVADKYAKDVVVIVCWDKFFNKIHTTTYGRSPDDKEAAARLGEILSTAAGADNLKATCFEDFRFKTQAEWAQEKEKLMNRIAELEQKERS
jgi:hypothetical protein